MKQVSIALMLLASSTASAQTVGVNAAVAGDVKMTTEANRAMHQAAVRERVSLGNDILTGRASRLQVLLLDKTNFTVGPNARIKVDRFVYDPSRNASSVGVNVTKGAFRFMSGKPTHANPGQSGIRTPTASIGIRGTIVEGAVGPEAIRIARAEAGLPTFSADPELATLVILRGPGAAAQGGELPGAIDVTVGGNTIALESPGLALFIPGPNAAPIGPFPISDRGSAMLSAMLGLGGYGFGSDGGLIGLDPPYNPLDDIFFDEICAKLSANGGPNGNPNQAGGGPCGPTG